VRGRASAFGRARCVAVRAEQGRVPKWEIVHKVLMDKGLRSVTPEDAKAMADSGKWVLVDVRPPPQYKQAHPAGAINIPLYQPLDMSKMDMGKAVRFVFYSLNGVTPVEANPEFLAQLKAATQGGERGIITLCEAGGTMKPSINFPIGKASRSLQAAYRSLTEGVTDQVLHLERGVYGWYQADLDFEGEGEYSPEISRTPMAAADPTLKSTAASAGYEMRPDDKVINKK